jgi:hypothetical protein
MTALKSTFKTSSMGSLTVAQALRKAFVAGVRGPPNHQEVALER